jgi:hypothetical protein
MSRIKLSNSVRKFLRREKARLRREILDPAEAETRIKELVVSVFTRYSGAIGRNKSDTNDPNLSSE